MSVIGLDTDLGQNVLHVKGAPENVVSRCDTYMLPDGRIEEMADGMRKEIDSRVKLMAGNALRTLALARKTDLQGSVLIKCIIFFLFSLSFPFSVSFNPNS